MGTEVRKKAGKMDGRPSLAAPVVVAVLLLMVVFLSLIINSILVMNREEGRVARVLEDSAKGQAETLNAVLEGQYETLEVFAASLAGDMPTDGEELSRRLRVMEKITGFLYVLCSDAQGVTYSGPGNVLDVSGRKYFQQAMKGQRSIERVDASRVDAEPRFVLSVPIIQDGQVVGAIHGSYNEQMLRELIMSNAYGGSTHSTILCEKGDVIIGSDSPEFTISDMNVFTVLEDAEFSGGYSLEQLREDTEDFRSGMFEYSLDGASRYVVYAPMDIFSSDGHRWYLINVLPSQVVESEVAEDMASSAVFFIVIMLSCLAALLYLVMRERRNIGIIDVERQNLRISEEQFRVATAMSSRGVARFDIKTGVFYSDSEELQKIGAEDEIENIPRKYLEKGVVAHGCEKDLADFYKAIIRGEPTSRTEIALNLTGEGFKWYEVTATTIFDEDGAPDRAVICYNDVTMQREKEVIYKKWQQSMDERDPGEFTLFRCNLNKNSEFDSQEGELLTVVFSDEVLTFNQRTEEYADQYVHEDDREAYVALLNSESLLAGYHRGERTRAMEYRELIGGGEFRWLRLTVDLVEYPNSTDVEAYLMYENVDNQKRAELLEKHKAESDPLTGVMNRTSFKAGVDALLEIATPETRHAMMILDIDDFKNVNDTLGHDAGDRALMDISAALCSIMRKGDLIGRLGGDEFFICIKDIPYDAITEKKARQLCNLVRRTVGDGVKVSASVGIATFPRDGTDFNTLYRHADTALYHVKQVGKDSYAFYEPEMSEGWGSTEGPGGLDNIELLDREGFESKRRVLVVDDNEMVRELLKRILEDRYYVDTASDGRTALVRMKHLGSGLAVVLLDLSMPGMDGFEVLSRMQQSQELKSIPVIVVSGNDDRETSLKAIECGAADYIAKPIDPELINIRVSSAISRAENEKLRAQNSYLLLQNDEETRYRTVLESTGTVVIEYDWINGIFTYDPLISHHIAGHYDNRTLWRVMLSDMVAGALDVRDMQQLVHDIASDRERMDGSMVVKLKTQGMRWHYFRMNVFKCANEFGLTDKLIITFNDVNEEILADERLRYQAERDELTGLYNRRTFLDKCVEWVSSKPENFYVMTVMDIDNFKLVNERYGHAEGDMLLVYLADRLKRDVGNRGDLCGRLSNDVFAALVPYRENYEQTVSDYAKQVLSEYPISLELTCSMGCCLIDDPSLPMESVLDRAVMAKQTVKGKFGARTAWYDEEMRESLMFEQGVAAEMEKALAEGQYHVYFQPQYNHATGQISGAEALVRWLHPERGMISPAEFIPIFEKNGFITKLDEFVWNKTAEHLRGWIESGHSPVPISVNVSRVDTADPHLCDKLQFIVESHHIPKDLFRIEITESAFVEDSGRIIDMVDKLHEMGFLVEMDDFGSGYSSLNILKDVPVDILKLDMRFFSGEGNQERGGTIINAVMRMARWLNMPVIAEGVETEVQADFLSSIGCRIIQGYLYARPMPVEEFQKLLIENEQKPAQPIRDMDFRPRSFALWDAESEDSRMFTDYMGAAVIYEMCNGNIEALRTNRRFLELMQFDMDMNLPTQGLIAMHEDDIPRFFAAARKAAEELSEQKVDVRRVFSDGREPLHLRCTLRTMAVTADRVVFLCSVEELID